jgi:hypothetical protein
VTEVQQLLKSLTVTVEDLQMKCQLCNKDQAPQLNLGL